MSKNLFKYKYCYQAAEAGDLAELKRMHEAGFALKGNKLGDERDIYGQKCSTTGAR